MSFKTKTTSFYRLSRLNRPTAILFLLFPCLFSIFFIFSQQDLLNLTKNYFFYDSIADFSSDSFKKSQIFVKTTFFFILGAIIMRCAGCVINDIIDRNLDKKVSRTASRPLATGEISLFEALIFLAILLSFGLMILLQFNQATIISGIFVLFLVISYPLMKRITFFPQLFLGITFNYGVIMASLALTNQIALSMISLYLACIFWTLIYDTIYGFQDIEDDLKAGIKSTSIKFSKNPVKILSILLVFMLFFLILAGYLQEMSNLYFLIIFFAISYKSHLIKNCDYKNPKDCLEKFKRNYIVGALILSAIILG